MINLQQLFNRAVRGLNGQGFQHSRADGACMYRSSDGRRCAVGWLIPNARYRKSIEHTTAGNLAVVRAVGILRDLIDTWPARKPKRTTIPLARVLHDAQWKRLDVPSVKRRQAMPIIDVEAR